MTVIEQSDRPRTIRSFEGLRGLAALLVFIYHLHHLQVMSPLADQFPLLFSRGWIFVDMFFVLSGWVMLHVYGQRFANTRSILRAFRPFLMARIARLYPLHLCTLSAMLAFYVVVPEVRNPDLPLDRLYYLLSQISLTFNWGPLHTKPPVPPAWSISAEMAAYCVFPVMFSFGVVQRKKGAWMMVAGGVAIYAVIEAAFGTIHVFDGRGALRGIAGFMIGMGFNRLWKQYDERLNGSQLTLIATVAAVVFVIGSTATLGAVSLLGLAGIIASMSSDRGLFAQVMHVRPLQWLGRISYSLYMWHWFAIVSLKTSLARAVMESGGSLVSVALVGASVLLILVFSEISVRYLEMPTRRALRRVLV